MLRSNLGNTKIAVSASYLSQNNQDDVQQSLDFDTSANPPANLLARSNHFLNDARRVEFSGLPHGIVQDCPTHVA